VKSQLSPLFRIISSIAYALILVGCGPSKAELEKQAREQKAAIDAAVAAELAKKQKEEQTRIELEAKARADAAAEAERRKAELEKEAERKREIIASRLRELEEAYANWGNVRKLSRANEVANVIAKLGNLTQSQQREELHQIELRKVDWRREDLVAATYYKIVKEMYPIKEGEVVDDAAKSELLSRFSTGADLNGDHLMQDMKRLFPNAKLD
jgi:hypothetical protein